MPAWPNDLLYMFPISILGIFGLLLGLAGLAREMGGLSASDPSAQSLSIAHGFFFRAIAGLATFAPLWLGFEAARGTPFGQSILHATTDGFQNLPRRPISSLVFLGSAIQALVFATLAGAEASIAVLSSLVAFIVPVAVM